MSVWQGQDNDTWSRKARTGRGAQRSCYIAAEVAVVGTASKTREPELVQLLLQASFYSPLLASQSHRASHCTALHWCIGDWTHLNWSPTVNYPQRSILTAKPCTWIQSAPEKCKVEKSLEPSDKGSSCKVSLPKFPEIFSCKVAFFTFLHKHFSPDIKHGTSNGNNIYYQYSPSNFVYGASWSIVLYHQALSSILITLSSIIRYYQD